ncbi:MAG: penicillin-binding protein 2, partial [Candidatus Omnitrophota bacterium]
QHNLFVDLEPRRGTIFDCNLRPQAINLPLNSLYATPNQINKIDKTKIIEKLSPILGLDKSFLRERLNRKKSFVWIARKLSSETTKKIENLKLDGIGFLKESKRCYPNKELASHVIGYAGLDNIGLEGLELAYDDYLKGQKGWAQVLRDARQRKLSWQKMSLPRDGYDLVLTIDEFIQYIAEKELDKVFQKYRAKAATIIVMNPKTGAILALANRPAYDLNLATKSSSESRRNRALCDTFEPGSVFKIVTASAGLETGKFKESDRFFCENGQYRVANHILHDHQPHGWLTFKQVFEESSNIGVTKIAQALGPPTIYQYAKQFNFGSKLGIELPGEVNGFLKEPRFWSKTSIGAVPIGQEVGVTALQLATSISCIANNGLMMKPYIVQRIQDGQGELIKEFKPQVLKQVISEDTARRVKDILVGVVKEGTGTLARVQDFSVAGKTGTAQKLEPDGRYSHSSFFATFMGFIPADKPVLAIVVIVDDPHPYYFGGVVSAPVFKNVATEVLKYLRVIPVLAKENSNANKKSDQKT